MSQLVHRIKPIVQEKNRCTFGKAVKAYHVEIDFRNVQQTEGCVIRSNPAATGPIMTALYTK